MSLKVMLLRDIDIDRSTYTIYHVIPHCIVLNNVYCSTDEYILYINKYYTFKYWNVIDTSLFKYEYYFTLRQFYNILIVKTKKNKGT